MKHFTVWQMNKEDIKVLILAIFLQRSLVYYKMGWNFNPPPEKTDKAILILIILFLLLQTDGIV